LKGWDADVFRRDVESKGIVQIQEDYEKFYSGIYDSVKVKNPTYFKDNRTANEISVFENYQMFKPWKREGDNLPVFNFKPSALFGKIEEPENLNNRKLPLGIQFPFHFRHTVRVKGKGINPAETFDSDIVEDEFIRFSFQKKYNSEGAYLEFDFELEHKKDRIPAYYFKTYMKHLEKIKENSAYEITWTSDAGDFKFNYLMVMLCIFGLIGSSYIAYKLFLWDPLPRSNVEQPYDIGGFLILVTLILIVSPILFLVQMEYSTYFDLNIWNNLTTPGATTYNSLWAPFLAFDLVFNTFRITLFILGLVLFYRKRTSFPAIFIGIYWTTCLYLIVNLAAVYILKIETPDTKNWNETGYALFIAIVWTAYFKYSERADNTFVNRLK
jgi:hypothetical protein